MYNVPAMKEKTYFIQIDGYCVEEEDFDKGCTGVIVNDTWYGDSSFYANSFSEIRNKLNEMLGVRNQEIDIQHMDNDLENLYYVTVSVNSKYESPTKDEIDMWRKGEYSLYLADLYFRIFEIRPVTSIEDIQKN